jgi:hypothetical protein
MPKNSGGGKSFGKSSGKPPGKPSGGSPSPPAFGTRTVNGGGNGKGNVGTYIARRNGCNGPNC